MLCAQCSHCLLGLVFSVASLCRPTVFLRCYSFLLLHFGQTNDDDNENDIGCHISPMGLES